MSTEKSPHPASRNASAKKTTPLWRRPFVLGGVLLAAFVAIGLWPKAVPVEVATVERGTLIVTVDEEGMTRVKNRYVISAPVAGQLRRIDWKAGAVVEAGKTVLAVLEPSSADFLDARSQAQAEARVRSAAASREAAVAQRDRAQTARKMSADDYARAQKLFERKALSAQEFDQAQMRATTAEQEARAADFAVQVAEFELEQAKAVLTRGDGAATASVIAPMEVVSPVSGRILKVYQESARVVPSGVPLLEIGDPADLEVRIEVLSRDGVAVRPGARVSLEQWGGAEPLAACVRLVEPSAFTKISALGVEEQRVYVVADFIDPYERRATLGDSYRVEARIVVAERQDVLRVPAGALFQRNGRWQAFLVQGGRAHLKTVAIGQTNGVVTEILNGANLGDQVVVYPGDKVAEGVRIEAIQVGRN